MLFLKNTLRNEGSLLYANNIHSAMSITLYAIVLYLLFYIRRSIILILVFPVQRLKDESEIFSFGLTAGSVQMNNKDCCSVKFT